jgi:hypothetical protein
VILSKEEDPDEWTREATARAKARLRLLIADLARGEMPKGELSR